MVFDPLQFAIILFLVVGVLFVGSALVLAVFLYPRAKGGDYKMPYECGMVPHNRAWLKFGLNYYVYALIFIAFDVDVLYLFPIAAWYKFSTGWLPLAEVSYFLFFVLLAVVYFKAKGVFEWPRRIKVS